MTGIISGVGVGPGDPELMTLKARRVIGEASAVFCLSADGKPSRALETARDCVGPDAEIRIIEMPMRADPAAGQRAYDKAAAEIAALAEAGRDAAVLCEGDPLLFGSFIYLLERLKPRFEVKVVPGIPSFLAAAAEVRMPLVRRMETLTLLPGTLPGDELAERLRRVDCAAILKAGGHLSVVRKALGDAGMASSALVVREATNPDQSISALSEIDGDRLPYFSIVLAWRDT